MDTCTICNIYTKSGGSRPVTKILGFLSVVRKGYERSTVRRSSGLRYETSEKKVDEVDFIFQGVELVSRVSATMTKARVKVNLTMRWWIDLLWKVVRWIDDEFVEEVEKLGWWFEQDIGDEGGWMKRMKMIVRIG
ncbi:hypothetical protein Tco_1200883 [Tanacetum coccineum]